MVSGNISTSAARTSGLTFKANGLLRQTVSFFRFNAGYFIQRSQKPYYFSYVFEELQGCEYFDTVLYDQIQFDVRQLFTPVDRGIFHTFTMAVILQATF